MGGKHYFHKHNALNMLSQKDRALSLQSDNLFGETFKYIESLKNEQSLGVPNTGSYAFDVTGSVKM
jgi:hypothetical protein